MKEQNNKIDQIYFYQFNKKRKRRKKDERAIFIFKNLNINSYNEIF
jgi:hypothetical protein